MTVLKRLSRYVLPALTVAAVPSLGHAQAASRPINPRPGMTLPRTYVGPATRPAISAADMMTRLYKFADDSMMGRDAGSEFHNKGTAYIAAELQRLGLEPLGTDGYFQYGIVSKGIDSAATTLSVDGTSYTLWRDFAPRDQGSGARSFDGMQVVYGGYLGDTAHMIPRGAEAGKIVLLTIARDSTGRRDFNSVNRANITARFAGAAAIAVQQIDYAPPGYVNAVYAGRQLATRTSGDGPVAPGRVLPSYFYVTDAVASAMLGANPETATPGMAGKTVRGTIRFGEVRAPGRNVVAVLRGSDPVLRNQYVVIGAHNDHVGFNRRPGDTDSVRAYHWVVAPQGADDPHRPPTAEELVRIRAIADSLHQLHGGPRQDSIYNGADDDGSGSMGVLEIAEYWANARNRPKRSLLFVWHAGEEYGMLGSAYFATNPTVPRDSIVAELNVDMIGRGGAADITGVTKEGAEIRGGPGYVQLIGSRRLSTELGDLAETVNRERRLGMNFDYSLDANGHPQNIYCRSDHASYARWGIPIVFFTTGGHADYHQVTDEPQYIDYNKMEQVTNMISALAERVANLDHRVVVDHPRPDPNANCQQ